MKRIIIGIALSLLAFAPAQAAEFYTTGPLEPSIIIGLDHQPGQAEMHSYFGMDRNRPNALNDADLPHFGIHAIRSGERSDYPCFLEIEFTEFDGGDAPDDQLSGRGAAFNRCGRHNVQRRSVEDVITNGGLGDWATGFAACSAGNGRIKGIRLISTRYRWDRQDKRVEVAGTNTDSFHRTNCGGNWSTQVSCLPGRIIVGMDVFYMRDNNGRREPDSIIGFQLQCRALAIRD